MAVLVQAIRQQPRSPWKVRYFLDTEFTSFEACELISVAVVSEVGREFYAECSDFERALCSDFVHCEVLPQLNLIPDRSMPLAQVQAELRAWFAAVPLKPRPVLCYDFEGDFTLIGHLLPKGWRAENVSSKLDQTRLAEYVTEHGHAHHALYNSLCRLVRRPLTQTTDDRHLLVQFDIGNKEVLSVKPTTVAKDAPRVDSASTPDSRFTSLVRVIIRPTPGLSAAYASSAPA